jgi:hydroxymethylbilane synthase
MSAGTLRIGTRRSSLARVQAAWVRDALTARFPDRPVELVPMETKGDKLLDAPLAKLGGKGLFVKELEEGLLDGRIDLAVHSLKDVPVDLPAGLHLGAVCEREDPRDALVAPAHRAFVKLPRGARVGTSSLRRQSQLLAVRPDLCIVPLRGNVQTRLEKLEREGLDAVVLAFAGLRRLGLDKRATEILDPCVSLPAIGQGSLAIECRAEDAGTNAYVCALDHPESALAARTERAFLATLGGGCQVPLGAYAVIEGDGVWLRAFVATPDGKRMVAGERRGRAEEGDALGCSLAEDLARRGAAEILAELEQTLSPEINAP